MSLARLYRLLTARSTHYFLEYLFVCVFLFDVIYIYLLHRHAASLV